MDINQIKEEYVIRNLCREAKIMSKLNHPCIVALFQTMQRSDNVYYLVTELVSGGDLCSFVKSQHQGKLEERPTRMYARQFASALLHMHGLGIVHRDLKMENVMLNSSQSQIKIVDFGLSNSWTADNPLRTHCGSPEYAAPELFITGKQYGAEVDLWSLGIILYGMVLGQLPFATTRGPAGSSQERRKRLVAQINRGLASPHRRALAAFSPDFRGLVGRLLTADAAARLTGRELAAHPWITERGRKAVRADPMQEVDAVGRNKIIHEISSILQIEKKLVVSALSHDPLGKIGGMFNILQRRYQMSQLHGDGVTRSVPSVTLLELSDMTKTLGKEKEISTERCQTQKKPHTAAIGRRTDYYCTPRMVDLNKHLRQVLSSPIEQIMKNKPTQTKPKKRDQPLSAVKQHPQRPSTVQPTPSSPAAPAKSRRLPDYRTIQSPNLRRKAYSATITPITKHTNRPFSPPQEKQKTVSPGNKREWGEVTLGRRSAGLGGTKAVAAEHYRANRPFSPPLDRQINVPLTNKREWGDVSLGRRSAGLKGIKAASPEYSSDDQRKYNRATDRPHSRPDQSYGRKRPVTGPLQQFFERSLKTAGVAMSRSVSKPAEKYQQEHVKGASQCRKRDKSWDICGDTSTRAVTVPYPPGRKPAIYDPIARSIADYVVNNVPHKLSSVPWVNKNK